MNLAQLALDADRYLEAEEELRRAERTALARGDALQVVDVYVMLGCLRGRQKDERGFVFFEQALLTCDTFGVPPASVARVRLEYGRFRKATGSSDEAREHLERARAIFESLGQLAAVEQVRAELHQLAA
jgi:tetratricopeptide (TPR) repeat protein